MDLTLQGSNCFYNLRVALIIKCGDAYLFEEFGVDKKIISVLGGRVRYGETLYDAARREAQEELGFIVENLQFSGVIEQNYHLDLFNAAIHEQIMVFCGSVAPDAYFTGDMKVQVVTPDAFHTKDIRPKALLKFMQSDTKYGEFQHIIVSPTVDIIVTDDVSFRISTDHQTQTISEYNVRATAIIRTKSGVLYDQPTRGFYKGNTSLVGGRFRLGEYSETAIRREVLEETGTPALEVRFRGIAEDFYSLQIPTGYKRQHFVHFMYEITIDEEAITPTVEASIVYLTHPEIMESRFKMHSNQAFVLDEKVYHSVAIDSENKLIE